MLRARFIDTLNSPARVQELLRAQYYLCCRLVYRCFQWCYWVSDVCAQLAGRGAPVCGASVGVVAVVVNPKCDL